MTEQTQPDRKDEIGLTKLRVEYWTKRLDHTLTHTQTSSRLIYFVDGGVLALLAFMLNNLGTNRPVVLLMAFPMFVLAILNFLHSELIRCQKNWYHNIDKKLLDLLNQAEIEFPEKKLGTHDIYRIIHIVIAISLLIATIMMYLYGIGYFQSIS